jgi:hypothetical protein
MNGPIVQHAGVYTYDYTNKWFTPVLGRPSRGSLCRRPRTLVAFARRLG